AEGIIDEHLENIKEIYDKKRLTMLEAMEEHFPPEVKWNRPEGGMFIWAELPSHINTRNMFEKAVDEKVAYVVGDAFFVDDGGYNTMRINFTHSSEEEIKEGIEALGKVIKKEIEETERKEESPISP
ncbi:MAG: aminotransferase class I/II-fold pyridoxal phosphate-dependent enzyme, partial [Candidatus Aenigmatarchaeota archaeon]